MGGEIKKARSWEMGRGVSFLNNQELTEDIDLAVNVVLRTRTR